MTVVSAAILMAICKFIYLQLFRKKYEISFLSFLLVYLASLIFGFVGAFLFCYLERGYWGIRYYGTVVFVDIVLLFLSKLIHYPYSSLMNYISPAGMLAIAIMKISCFAEGCCSGRVIHLGTDHIGFVFPSQIVELVVAIVFFVVLILMEINIKTRDYIASTFWMLYGGTRLIFDGLRKDQGRQVNLGLIELSVGEITCLFLFLLGVVSLVYRMKHSRNVQ